MRTLKIGIQGVRASFHDVAARKYFKALDQSIEPVEFDSFKSLCEALASDQLDFALMAIENSIAGSILTNYQLLERFEFKIVGEVYQRIIMNIMALPGQALSEINTVWSHPMALLQCEDFFSRQPHLKRVEMPDTAESAKEIGAKRLLGVAAIASELAAQVYGLNILEQEIESDRQNYTRFLVISKSAASARAMAAKTLVTADKTSIRFEIPHRAGSLVSILSIFDSFAVNLTKLQSVPIIGRPYEYAFHLDLEWDDVGSYHKAMREIESKTISMVHFGDYKGAWRSEI